MNNPWMWHAVKNIALFILVGVCVWKTDNLWALCGLWFMSEMKSGDKP